MNPFYTNFIQTTEDPESSSGWQDFWIFLGHPDENQDLPSMFTQIANHKSHSRDESWICNFFYRSPSLRASFSSTAKCIVALSRGLGGVAFPFSFVWQTWEFSYTFCYEYTLSFFATYPLYGNSYGQSFELSWCFGPRFFYGAWRT